MEENKEVDTPTRVELDDKESSSEPGPSNGFNKELEDAKERLKEQRDNEKAQKEKELGRKFR